jgi:PDZ domain-containing secreted protein
MALLSDKLDLLTTGMRIYVVYILAGIIITLSLTTLWYRSEANNERLTVDKLRAESAILNSQKQALLAGLNSQSEEVEKLRINLDKAEDQYNDAKNHIEIKYNNLLDKKFKNKLEMCDAIIALDREEIKNDENITNE